MYILKDYQIYIYYYEQLNNLCAKYKFAHKSPYLCVKPILRYFRIYFLINLFKYLKMYIYLITIGERQS